MRCVCARWSCEGRPGHAVIVAVALALASACCMMNCLGSPRDTAQDPPCHHQREPSDKAAGSQHQLLATVDRPAQTAEPVATPSFTLAGLEIGALAVASGRDATDVAHSPPIPHTNHRFARRI